VYFDTVYVHYLRGACDFLKDYIMSVPSLTAGLPVVLKFLKCHICPEILLIWSECPGMDLCYVVVTALHLFCTLLS